MLNALMPLYTSGGQFLTLVKLNSKILVYHDPAEKPRFWETIQQQMQYRAPRKADGKRGERKFDLAIRTGKWRLPDRNPDEILISFDVDQWPALEDYIKDILKKYPTFVLQTIRGVHFFYFVPKWFSKSGGNGVVDWLARGKIAVLTGSDRQVLHSRPVATLPEDEARVLYEYATTREAVNETRSYRAIAQDLADFHAVQGERNTRINGELYRHRQLAPDELEALARQLAAQCTPPYPIKETLAVKNSIVKNRPRFPTAPKPTAKRESVPTSIAYTRLGDIFPRIGMTFTRQQYEQRLLRRGWLARKKLGVAYHDLRENLAQGEIEIVGQLPSGKQGGRPQHLYRRVREYRGKMNTLLPGAPTARQIRLSLMLAYLPDESTPVTRDYLRVRLGLKDVGTISRYSQLLADPSRWGQALIHKQTQAPTISTWALTPSALKESGRLPQGWFRWLWQEFVRYQPSHYQRTAYSHEVMAQRTYPAKPVEVGIPVVESPTVATLQSRLDKLLQESTPQERWAILNGLKIRDAQRLAAQGQSLSHKKDMGETTPCSNVAILLKTPAPPPDTGWQQTHQRLPQAENPPPEGVQPPVQPPILADHEDKKSAPPVQAVAPIPESELPGYPMNYYLGGGQALFDYIEACYLRKDMTLWEFQQRISAEAIAAWETYRFIAVVCSVCGQVSHIHPTETAPGMCAACQLAQAKQHPLPDEARTVLAQYDTHRFDYLWDLFAQIFHTHPRTKKEVRIALETYGWQWVEFAIRAIGEKQAIRYPWPAVVGTLKNWQQQGYINYDDLRRLHESRVRQLLSAWGYALSMWRDGVQRDSVFHAYDRFVDSLTEDTAYLIAEAVRVHGERAVRHAIAEAYEYRAHRWGYCEKILERLKEV